MKHRGALGKTEAKTATHDSNYSVTIAEFESGKFAEQRRVAFQELISIIKLILC